MTSQESRMSTKNIETSHQVDIPRSTNAGAVEPEERNKMKSWGDPPGWLPRYPDFNGQFVYERPASGYVAYWAPSQPFPQSGLCIDAGRWLDLGGHGKHPPRGYLYMEASTSRRADRGRCFLHSADGCSERSPAVLVFANEFEAELAADALDPGCYDCPVPPSWAYRVIPVTQAPAWKRWRFVPESRYGDGRVA